MKNLTPKIFTAHEFIKLVLTFQTLGPIVTKIYGMCVNFTPFDLEEGQINPLTDLQSMISYKLFSHS